MFKNIRNFNIRKHRKRENRNIKKKTKRRKKLSRIIPFQRRKFKRKGTRPDKTRQKGRGRTEAVQVSDAAISQDVSWRGSREWSVGVTPGRGYGAVIAGENLWKTAGHR